MKIINFDLELAKKITSGELDGEVLYYSKSQFYPMKARIICFDLKSKHSYRGVVAVTALSGIEFVTTFDLNPRYAGVVDDRAKLVLKVPDTYQAQIDRLMKAIEENGYRWNAEKLELEEAKEFKPFDRVIGKYSVGNTSFYQADLFSNMGRDGLYYCIGGTYDTVYPFEGNEHLLEMK